MTMNSDNLKELEGYNLYEDILKEIDEEVNNINKVIQPQYQALQSGASGKMIY